ncbi:MAG: NYN domain-containing protein [Rhodobacteraceae bacterium]|nr:NYN domain-containing protein [Paracoccaceae bacterium]
MVQAPKTRRAVSFIDGQNLFRHAKDAFGHHHPNYDPVKLTEAVCNANNWDCISVRFYTGVPESNRSAMWHGYWVRRLNAMRNAGVAVTSRPLRYSDNGKPREKGIDLRLGLDVVRMARKNEFDVAVIFSQDQDLAEVALEVRDIAKSTGRWLKVASAFPCGPSATSGRGIDRTDWFPMDRNFYDSCLDQKDYRPPCR